MATIYDVAQRSGVSTATVSRALRGRSEVATELRERVVRVAEELGYRPNRLAQALTRGKTGMLGLVLPEPGDNPFYGVLMGAVSRRCRAHAYEPIVLPVTLETEESITEAALYLEETQVDGLLLFAAPVHLEHYAAARGPGSPPMIAIGSPLDFQGPNVRADEAGGAYEATRHLLSMGHRSIAYLGPVGAGPPGSRQAGYARAMDEAGCAPSLADTDSSMAQGRQRALELAAARERPTALVCFSDETALGAMRGLHEAGLRIPDDVSVTGFDNLELARYAEPPLTSVDPHTNEIVDLAVRHLVATVRGEAQETAAPRLTVAATLAIRESSGPPPTTDA